MITLDKLRLVKEIITRLPVCQFVSISIIAIHLSKQQTLGDDPRAIQQINFTRNLIRKNAEGQDIDVGTAMLFIIEKLKDTIQDFTQGTVKVL